MEVTDEMIERAAEAICDVPPLEPVWASLSEDKKEGFRYQAYKALNAALGADD